MACDVAAAAAHIWHLSIIPPSPAPLGQGLIAVPSSSFYFQGGAHKSDMWCRAFNSVVQSYAKKYTCALGNK